MNIQMNWFVKATSVIGILMTISSGANAETLWARCDACSPWQGASTAMDAVPPMTSPINQRVGIIDFEAGNHRVFSVLRYYDYELGGYESQVYEVVPTAAETNKISALADIYIRLQPYYFEAGDPEPLPLASCCLDFPSAFTYWENPGRTNTRLSDAVWRLVENFRPDLIDRTLMKLYFPAGTKVKFQLSDGTFVTLESVSLRTGGFPLSMIDFEVTQLQTADGTAIPLIRSDLDSDWAAIVVSGGDNLNVILDELSGAGVTVYVIGERDESDDDDDFFVECEFKDDGELVCTATPVPRDPK